jgi:hypothetical protein
MATRRSSREVAEAVQSLFRIRGAESPPDAEGVRSVWHQGARGADLVSFVDGMGHVTRAELTLFEDYFVWTSQHGLRTGEVEGVRGSRAYKSSDNIRFDPAVEPERIQRAQEGLRTYEGQDRYILHFRQLIALATRGVEFQEEPTITRITVPGPIRRHGWRVVIGAVIVALAGAVLGVLAAR